MEFSKFWGKKGGVGRKGTPVVVTMENPNISVVEIEGPDSAFRPVERSRGKNAKQVTWVLLLRAHRAVGCVAWLAALLWAVLGAVKTRLSVRASSGEAEKSPGKGKLLFRVIKALLAASLAMLGFEVVCYFQGWDYFRKASLHIPRTSSELQGWLHGAYVAWLGFRAGYVAPAIQALSTFCVVLFLIQSLDRMVLSFGCLWIKYRKIKPTIVNGPEDVEKSGRYEYPMVLVQIPMCNEREVKLVVLLCFTSILLSLFCCFRFFIFYFFCFLVAFVCLFLVFYGFDFFSFFSSELLEAV